MDPFSGLGSTAVACARLNVNFIGAEIDEAYMAQAIPRTKAAVLDEAMGRRRLMAAATSSSPKRAQAAASASIPSGTRPARRAD